MAAALVISGLIYTALSYVETVAYPSAQALAAAASHGVPLASIATAYLTAGFGKLITVAAVISGFGVQLATVNGATRLPYAAGRPGRARPGPPGAPHPDHRAGVTAIVTAAATGAPCFGSPLDAFTDLAPYGADLIIVAYLATIIAALTWIIRRRRATAAGVTLLAAGAAAIGYVIKVTVWPLPAGAPRLYLYAAAATILAGVGVAAVRRPCLAVH